MEFKNIHAPASNKLEFEIWNVDLSVVNAVRRIILAEIPNVAFPYDALTDNNPEIKVYENTGPLHNEFLLQRISLIPLHFSQAEIADFKPEDYVFKINKKNTAFEPIKVTTADFEIYDITGQKYSDEFHARVLPKDPITGEHVMITLLRPNLHDPQKGEALHIELIARRGIAKEHSRWCPVSKCSFFNKIDEDKRAIAYEAESERVRSLPDATEETIARFEQKFDTLDKYRYFHQNMYDEPCAFTFQIESECNLEPRYLFTKALDIMEQKIATFQQRVTAQYYKVTHHDQLVVMEIPQQDYTLVNTLQCCMYNNCLRDNLNSDPFLTYIGYYQSHPLDQVMLLKMRFQKDGDALSTENVCEFVEKQCNYITEYIQRVRSTWLTQSCM